MKYHDSIIFMAQIKTLFVMYNIKYKFNWEQMAFQSTLCMIFRMYFRMCLGPVVVKWYVTTAPCSLDLISWVSSNITSMWRSITPIFLTSYRVVVIMSSNGQRLQHYNQRTVEVVTMSSLGDVDWNVDVLWGLSASIYFKLLTWYEHVENNEFHFR